MKNNCLGSVDRYWQIRVDQIPCGTLYTPPQGCMQYFMAASGHFQSFNYGIDDSNYHHLVNQDYAICFRRASGSCKIGYIPANDGESFYLSFKPTTPTVKSRVGESGCLADFILIPRGTSSSDGQGSCSVCLQST